VRGYFKEGNLKLAFTWWWWWW